MLHLSSELRWTAYDFAYWLDMPRATVRNWYLGNFEPRGFQKLKVHAALDLLETAMTKGLLRELDGVSAHDRPKRIRWLRTRADSGFIPRPRSADKRLAGRVHRERGEKV